METYDLHPTTSLHASRKGKGEGGGLVGPIRRLTETPNRMSHAFATHSFATYLTRRMYDHSSSSRCLAFDSIGMVCLPTGRTEQVLLLLRAVCTTKTGLLGPAASPRKTHMYVQCVCMCVSDGTQLGSLSTFTARSETPSGWSLAAYCLLAY